LYFAGDRARALPVKRLELLLGLAGILSALACNSVLGIDPAERDNDASVGGGSDAATSACSLKTQDPCNSCVAQNCCQPYEACLADPDCKQGLVEYAFCLGNNFTSDAGASCDEAFATTPVRLALSECAFITKCRDNCRDQTIGDLCFTYCSCMAMVCPDKGFDGGTCAEACDKFDADQLICRPYHCNLATLNMADPVKRALHCGHAAGAAPCH
jgi:hypothetical protein